MTDLVLLKTTTDKMQHQAKHNHQTATTLTDTRKWRARHYRLGEFYRFLELLREYHPEYMRKQE